MPKPVTLPVQTKIIHISISNHCVGVQVSNTFYFWQVFFEQVIVSQVVVIGVVGGLIIIIIIIIIIIRLCLGSRQRDQHKNS